MVANRQTVGTTHPPAIILGGENGIALSIARSLGRRGVPVHLLARPECLDRWSRYVNYISPSPAPSSSDWLKFLLGDDSRHLQGSVIIAASDVGLEFLMAHREELSRKYLLDISDSEAQHAMLNKLTTYQKSVEAQVPTPRFWKVTGPEDVADHKDEYIYPLMVKPLYSHKFSAAFHYGKYFLVDDLSSLMKACSEVWNNDVQVILMERIPGPDNLLCSYYTYIDENGNPLLEFTKRVMRRYPISSGVGCYHITDHIPEARDLAKRLFRHVGLLGVANVEFKYDERDGQLKIIECNARFTAANRLVAAAGFDLAWLVYSRAVGASSPPQPRDYRRGLRLWRPGWDLLAFLDLRAQGDLTLASWARSLLHRQHFQYFSLSDPGPWIASGLLMPRRLFRYLRRPQ